jgi:hypothetical protein
VTADDQTKKKANMAQHPQALAGLHRHHHGYIVSHDKSSGIVARRNGLLDSYGDLDLHGATVSNALVIKPPQGQPLTLDANVVVSGAVSLGGDLAVAGDLAVSGDVAIAGDLAVSGSVAIPSAVLATLNVTTLNVSGATTLLGLVTFGSSPVDFGGAALVGVGSVAPSAGLLNILSGLSLGGLLNVNGHAITNVTSISPQAGTITLAGDVVLGPGFTIGGSPLTTSTALAVNGGLAVTGNTTLSGGTISFSGNPVTNVLSLAPSGPSIAVLGDLDMSGHSLLHTGGISTPAAGTLTLSGTNLNVTTTTSTFTNFKLTDGSQAPGKILQTVLGDGTGTWVLPTSVSLPIGCLAFSGAYPIPFLVIGTAVEIAAGGVGALLNSGFTSPGNVGRLKCAFGAGVILRARVVVTVTYTSVVVGLETIVFTPRINGVAVAGVDSTNSFTGPLALSATATLTFTALLNDLDEISLFCANNTSLVVVVVSSLQISVAS